MFTSKTVSHDQLPKFLKERQIATCVGKQSIFKLNIILGQLLFIIYRPFLKGWWILLARSSESLPIGVQNLFPVWNYNIHCTIPKLAFKTFSCLTLLHS